MAKRLIIMLVIVAAVFGVFYGLKQASQQGGGGWGAMPPTTVSATTVETQHWPSVITAVGSVIAVDGVAVTTEVEGTIATLDFISSTKVEKGDVLITLESSIERADLKVLEAEAAEAQRALKRIKALHERRQVSQSEYDQALSKRNETAARVAAQKVRLEHKIIRAPFTGWLGIRQVNPGQFLDVGTSIVTIQSIDPLLINFRVPDRYLPVLKKGQAMTLRSAIYPGEPFPAEVAAVENVVDQATRSLHALGLVPNPTGKLRPGLFTDIEIALPGDQQVIAVPRTAISYQPYGNSVFVIKAKEPAEGEPAPEQETLILRQRFVKTGEARGDFVAVTEGLEAGDQVVTSGLLKLRNEMPVVIDNTLAPDPELNPAPADT